jgi:hypothetical protein
MPSLRSGRPAYVRKGIPYRTSARFLRRPARARAGVGPGRLQRGVAHQLGHGHDVNAATYSNHVNRTWRRMCGLMEAVMPDAAGVERDGGAVAPIVRELQAASESRLPGRHG